MFDVFRAKGDVNRVLSVCSRVSVDSFSVIAQRSGSWRKIERNKGELGSLNEDKGMGLSTVSSMSIV